MFFSIIIPIYNSGKWLKRCFDSVRNQTFTDYEVVMINDDSTDDSEAICQEYAKADSRAHYYKQPVRGGVSAARNRGLNEARGQFVCFLDSDDAYEKDFLMKFYSLIQEYSDADAFYCGFKMVEGTKILAVNKLPNPEEVVCMDRKQAMILYNAILFQSSSNKAYRREIIERANLRFKEDVSFGEDLLFNLNYLDNCKSTRIIVENMAMYNYCRDNPNSLMNRYNPDYRRISYEITDKMGESFRKWELDSDQMVLYYNAVYNMMVNSMRNTFRLANPISRKEKVLYNNEIIRSKYFKDAVKNSKGVVNPVYKIAYSFNDYRLIQFLDRIRPVYLKYIKAHLYKNKA